MKDEELEINHLCIEFKILKNYLDKLKFYDKHFSLVPFNFPSFTTNLGFLLGYESFKHLNEILEKERHNNFSFSKKLFCNSKELNCDVTPHNSNIALFNEYIITKFTEEDENLNRLILQATTSPFKKYVRTEISEINKSILTVEAEIGEKKDRTFRTQMLNVFHKGYLDYNEKKIKKFFEKKKFIELFLYSKGILLAKYKEVLFTEAYANEKIGAARSKVYLLNELGVTAFLKEKYKSLGEKNLEDKIVKLFSAITGESPTQIKTIINY